MRFFREILDVFFPVTCGGCGKILMKNENLICFGCREQLPKICISSIEDNEITDRFLGKITVNFGIAYLYFNKSGITQHLMHALKYKGQKQIGKMLGEYFGYEIAPMLRMRNIDCIIPVPLHPRKKNWRGYNQSNEIAEGFGNAINIDVLSNALVRIKYDTSQTRKSREERWSNVCDAFKVTDPNAIKDKSILLIDDVITTGATLEACAKVLEEAGASRIGVAALSLAK